MGDVKLREGAGGAAASVQSFATTIHRLVGVVRHELGIVQEGLLDTVQETQISAENSRKIQRMDFAIQLLDDMEKISDIVSIHGENDGSTQVARMIAAVRLGAVRDLLRGLDGDSAKVAAHDEAISGAAGDTPENADFEKF